MTIDCGLRQVFGDRTAVKRQKEDLEDRRQQSKEAQRENSNRERERNVEKLDGGNTVLLSGEDAGTFALVLTRSLLVILFCCRNAEQGRFGAE